MPHQQHALIIGAHLVLQVSPIQIGQINLQDFEIPESIRFGGRHRLIVHSLAGGQRTIERLGPDDSEIRFQGIFSGADAENRARAFDNLRLSGDIIWLTWESFRRQVIVKSFMADFHSPWWISYRVSCLVVRQEQIKPSLFTTVMAMLSSDLSNALSAGAGFAIALPSLQTALSASNVLTRRSRDQVEAIATVAATLKTVNDIVVQQSQSLVTPFGISESSSAWGPVFASSLSYSCSLSRW